MRKTWFKLSSILLVIVLLANMLPLQTFAEQLNTEDMSLINPGTDLNDKESVSGKIVEELTDKRTEYTKQFRMDNGLFIAAVYSDPIHYEEDGRWVEIDNTLTAQLNGTYTNTAGVWDVSFPHQLTSNNRISVTKDTYTLSFGMAGELRTGGNLEIMSAGETAMPAATDALSPSGLIESGVAETFAVTQAQAATAQLETVDIAAIKAESEHPEMVADKLYSGLRYNNVFGTTDIRYQLNANTVKESIILESYSSTLQGYRYILEVGDLNPILQDDGSIYFYDADQREIVMVMEAPFLVDDALEYNFDVQVRLTGSGSTYTLTYLLPGDWLASADRAWPVVLDPTITTNLHHSNVRDVTVTEKYGSRPSEGIVECGYGQQDGIQRFFLMYDEIPTMTSSDVIVSAEVTLHKLQTSTTTATVQVHEVMGRWDSNTITWSNKPAFNSNIEDFRVVRELGYYTWDVTDIVRGWYSGENTGMMFKANAEVEAAQTNNWKQFASSNYSYYPDQMPKVTIQFKNNNGLESYWDYTSFSAGRAGTGYVNNYTGNLVWAREDIGFGGNRMPVAISHVYNANDAVVVTEDDDNTNNSNDTAGNAFGLGNGWRTNYNQLVYEWSKDSTYYVWEDADGTDHYFTYDDDEGAIVDEDDLELVLTIGADTWKYCITDKDDNTSYFDTSGRLIKLENKQATTSSVNITYDGDTKRIATITDGAGRKYNFTYNDSGLLTRISYVGSGTTELSYVTFEYDSGSSNLTEITDKDGKTSRYAYSYELTGFDPEKQNPNLLTSATDIDGYKLMYTYNIMDVKKPSRIHTVTETDVQQDAPEGSNESVTGGVLNFDYQHNQTTITDRNGNKRILQFNNEGHTKCIQDGEGRAQYAEYYKNDDGTEKGTQLKVASKLQYTVGNIVSDSSFESGTLWSLEPSSAAASRSISSTGYYGSKSLYLTATGAANLLGSTFTVPAGESYTFSAYVKVSGGSARLALRNTADPNDIEYSEALTSDAWTRLEICYTNEGTGSVIVVPILSAATGTTVYMDCVQIEKAPTASRYNLVENGDFRYSLDTWTKNGCTTADTVAVQTKTVDEIEVEDPAAPQLDAYAFKITGSPTTTKRLTQTIQVSGAVDDSFVFAGWAKGNAATIQKKEQKNSSYVKENFTREFGIQLQFNYTDGTSSDPFTVHFNTDSNEWQYVSAAAVAKKAYTSITIRLVYDHNVNTVSFDGIQLYKEVFGTSYTYDEDGNVISAIDLQKQETKYEYKDNNLTKIIEPGSKITKYDYDKYNNVIAAVTSTNQVYLFTYDEWGNNTSVSITYTTQPDSEKPYEHVYDTKITSSAVYTEDGNRLVSTKDALGQETFYSYNTDTNVLEWVKYPNDTDATKTTYTYDDMYRMATAAVTTNLGQSLSAAYTYENDLLKSIQTESTTYGFSYGNFGLRTSVDIGERNLAKYFYTQDGNNYLSRLDYGNGGSVEYEYDGLGRVTKETYEDNDTVTYRYDNSGALATVTDSETGRTTTYYYDLTDRLMKYVETGENYYHSVGYAYDAKNNLTSLVETINGTDYTTSYVYDDDNRLTAMTTNGTTVEYTYDDYGRVTTQVTKRGETTILTETFTYVNPSETTTSSRVATYKTETANYSIEYSYTYDDNGNILSVNDGTYTTSYVYDSANQLIRENNQWRNRSYTWTYDNAGNVLSEKTYAYTTGDLSAATPTATNSYSYNDEKGWGDLLTAYNGTAITYDEIGNPNGYNDRTFTWEHGRQMATQTKGGVEWEYTYNNAGLRTKRTNGSTTYDYVYSGDKLVQMTITDHTTNPETVQLVELSYDASGQPLTMALDGTMYYYVLNIQGDVMGLVDGSGNLMLSLNYEGYGEGFLTNNTSNMVTTLASTNPLGYRGYVMDVGTGLYYLQSRYYDPVLGRFINSDTYMATGNGLKGNNMFAYCLNNPVNMADSDGKDAIVVVELKLGENGLPVVGHISVYIQDAEGNWYVTQFNGSKKRNAKIYVDPADEVMLQKMLNGEEISGKRYEYFKGDFSDPYEYATTLKGTNYGGYLFFTNNCADYAHDVLSKGEFSDKSLTDYLEEREPLVPIIYLWRLQFREKLTKVKQLVKEVISCVETYYE